VLTAIKRGTRKEDDMLTIGGVPLLLAVFIWLWFDAWEWCKEDRRRQQRDDEQRRREALRQARRRQEAPTLSQR